jgi:guanine deaminase
MNHRTAARGMTLPSADRRFLRRAIALAERHSRGGRHGPFGAVVVAGGAVVGQGWNRVVAGRDPTAHAEVVAIRTACRRLRTHVLSGCTIYCSCEPCPMCLGAIYWARIARVVFACGRRDAARAGFDDELLYREIPRPWPDRGLAWRQLGREQGVRVLERWLHNPQRRAY